MKKNRGFTFVEVIIVTAIFLLLAALVAPNVLNFQSSSSSDGIVEVLLADIKNQQIKAMTGDTEGRGIPDTYGIYIQPSSYTLFHGQVYSPSDEANFEVDINSPYQLVSNFPNDTLIFASGSGEVVNFSPTQNQIIIQEARTGQQKIIELNKYGVHTIN